MEHDEPKSAPKSDLCLTPTGSSKSRTERRPLEPSLSSSTTQEKGNALADTTRISASPSKESDVIQLTNTDANASIEAQTTTAGTRATRATAATATSTATAGSTTAELRACMGTKSQDDHDFRVIDNDPDYVVCEDGLICYRLNPELDEKEASVERQLASEDEYPARASPKTHNLACLTPKSKDMGIKVFAPYALGLDVPQRPSHCAGFHFVSPDVVAFRGVGGNDMAKLWHMLVLPRGERAMQVQGGHAQITLRWVYDLKPEHAPLLREMRKEAHSFFRVNRAYFEKRAEPGYVARWLDPSAIRFGFHSQPSVGYLHMHVLAGPLTTFGAKENFVIRWVPLESVLEVLDAGLAASSMLGANHKGEEEAEGG